MRFSLFKFILVFSIFLNLLMVWALIWGNHGLLAYNELKYEYTELSDTVERLDKKNLLLSREIRFLQSDKRYIEFMIRKRFNFVKNNEILYVFPAGQSAQTGVGTDEAKN